nr:hypothetical protein [Streptomyces sp.]
MGQEEYVGIVEEAGAEVTHVKPGQFTPPRTTPARTAVRDCPHRAVGLCKVVAA